MANALPLLIAAGAAAFLLTKKKGGSGGSGGVVASGAMRNGIGIYAEWRVVQGKLEGFAGAPGFTAEVKLARDPSFTVLGQHGTKEAAVDAAKSELIAKGFTVEGS